MHTWTLPHAFNSVDHKALWWWLWELNVCQTLRAHYEADLPYEKTALTWHKAGRQTVSIAFRPYLEHPLFGVEALKAANIGHRIVTGLQTSARGFADGLVLVHGSSAGMQRQFGVVAQLLQLALDECQARKVRHYSFRAATRRDSQEAPPCLAVRLSTSRGG